MNKVSIQKLSYAISIFSFLLLSAVGHAVTVTKTFQEGTDGYAGTTDVVINEYNAATVPSNETRLDVNFKPTATLEHTEVLLRFDLSSIPSAATISAVTLKLTETRINSQDTSDVIILDKVTSSWTESTTWNTRPSSTPTTVTPPPVSSIASATTNAYDIAGMESLVQEWVSTPSSNFGLKLSSTNSAINFRVQSSEDGTVAFRPALEVTYDVPASVLTTVVVTPASAVTFTGSTKQFTAAGLDQFGNPMPIAFSWTVTGVENSVDSTGLVTVGSFPGTFTITATGGGKSGSTTFNALTGASVSLEPSEDTNLDSAQPTTDLGSKGSVNIGFFTGTVSNFLALIRFDVSSIPVNATILSAKLTLTTSGRDSVGSTDVLNIGLVTSTWAESHTYSMGVPTSTPSGISVTQPSTNPLVISNLNSIVQGWVTNSAGNKGLMLSTTNDMYFRFTSSENGTVEARPKLEIEYAVVAPVFTSISVTPGNTIAGISATTQFTATALDQFGTPMVSQPGFSWSVSGGGTIDSSGLFTGTTQGSFSVTATSGGKSGSANFQVAHVVTLQDGLSSYAGTTDAYIDQIAPSTTNGGAASLSSAWNRIVASVITERREGLIRFDLSPASIPGTATIIAANLTMVVQKSTDVDPTDVLFVDKVTSAWDETTVTWSTAPTTTASGVTPPPIGALAVNGSYTITNLQSLVQGWLSAPSSNFGIKLYTDTANPKVNLSFASRENTSLAKPALQIFYTIPGGGDTDALPDAWEIEHFGTTAWGENDDPDGDGLTNIQEYSAGTVPSNKGDRFTMSSQAPAGGNFSITWSSISGRSYDVQMSEDLSSWMNIETVTGAAGTTTWTDDGSMTGDLPSDVAKRFYRIKTQ